MSVTLSVNSPTGQTPQRIFTVDSLKDADLCKDVLLAVSVMNNHIYGSKVPQNLHFGSLNRYTHFKPNYAKNSNSYIFISVYQCDMKFDRQLRPSTETSWVVSYDGKTIPRWRTAAILKIVISPYLSEKKSSDINEILYTAADFELDERHVIKNEKVELGRLRVRQNMFLVLTKFVTLSLSLFKLFPSRLSWVVGADVVRGLGWVHYFAGLG